MLFGCKLEKSVQMAKILANSVSPAYPPILHNQEEEVRHHSEDHQQEPDRAQRTTFSETLHVPFDFSPRNIMHFSGLNT